MRFRRNPAPTEVAEPKRPVAETRAHAQAQAEQHPPERGSRAEEDRQPRGKRARERGELESRVTELEAQIEELQGTLERERSERMARETDLEQRLERAGTALGREHGMRLMAEQQLGDALASLQESQQELDRQTAAGTTQVGRLEELQRELGDAREETARERAEHQRGVRQHLDALGQSETDARRAREKQLSELERARAEAVQRAETAESALRAARQGGARAADAAARPELRDAAGADESSSEAGPAEAVQAEGRELPARQQMPNRPSTHADPTGGGKTRGRRRLLGARLRRRSLLPCAVCRRPRPAASDAEATAIGWTLRKAGTLCPTCQREGWQFPDGAIVPFRSVDFRSSA
jgi:hypothetical protein